MPTPCYLLEATTDERRWLRRYVSEHEGGYTCAEGWHEARALVENGPAIVRADGIHENCGVDQYDGDPRWPIVCDEGCGYLFTSDDHWQVLTRLIYRCTVALPGAAANVGDYMTIEDAPPGAMWYADWIGDWGRGPDGRSLHVKLPDGHNWNVDGEATNCTRKGDRSHKCWIRDGVPPLVTAGKDGETCAAGAGSIQTPGYHGFLRDGVLT